MKLLEAIDHSLKGGVCCCLKEEGNTRNIMDLASAIACPCWVQQRIDRHTKSAGTVATKILGSCFICWFLFQCLEPAEAGLAYIGWLFYSLFACVLAYERSAFRQYYLLEGDMGTDCCQAFFCYPFVLLQQLTEAELVELTTRENKEYAE